MRKLLGLLVCASLVAMLSIGSTGCTKKDEKEKAKPPVAKKEKEKVEPAKEKEKVEPAKEKEKAEPKKEKEKVEPAKEKEKAEPKKEKVEPAKEKEKAETKKEKAGALNRNDLPFTYAELRARQLSRVELAMAPRYFRYES